MLRAYALDFGSSWDEHLSLCEFAYNNCYQFSTGMTLFKTLYGRSYRSLTHWNEVGNRCSFVLDYVQEVIEKVDVIRRHLFTAQNCQQNYADNRRWPLEFAVDDCAFIKAFLCNVGLRYGHKGKLSLCFIGPLKIVERTGPLAYCLTLIPGYTYLHNVFHVFMI